MRNVSDKKNIAHSSSLYTDRNEIIIIIISLTFLNTGFAYGNSIFTADQTSLIVSPTGLNFWRNRALINVSRSFILYFWDESKK